MLWQKATRKNKRVIFKELGGGNLLPFLFTFVLAQQNVNIMTEDEKIKVTNDILSRIPSYGEFEIIYDKVVPPVTNTTAENMIKNVAESVRKQNMILAEQEVIQELVFGGFIVNRHDIKIEDKTYMQLTDRGRELKELGSMEAYGELQKQKAAILRAAAAQRAMEVKRNGCLFWITLLIAIATGFAAVYYILEILRIQYHLGLPRHVLFS